ncbi:hypothetical protein CQ018_17030 [Arthrobacter sp. MYb227]|uniref:molybdenum cofactor guanylyltransferase n=1 Tax=Arthrobacter sp. MYb227 TaxID=1848601 RepID=UPI000CFB5DE5|nr:NTP transferase domain-containing protein [Arthrobacter sp. MYb227]PQZ88150.1 hypothetical protein CQ018_17030 [Arthrobacter sp. MYb227]
MKFDAIIVAGGRGSRMGGVSKPLLEHHGETLLEHSLNAVHEAQCIAVVGAHALAEAVARYMENAPETQRVVITREYPSYAGPAAAVAAGRAALDDGPDEEEAQWPISSTDVTVVLASDLLDPAPVVAQLLAMAGTSTARIDAWVPQDATGRLQTLSCAIRTSVLREAIKEASAAHGSLENASMMRLLATVQMERLKLPDVDFSDIDTLSDAGKHGIIVQSGEH